MMSPSGTREYMDVPLVVGQGASIPDNIRHRRTFDQRNPAGMPTAVELRVQPGAHDAQRPDR